jgi:hypothetical protein
MSGKNMFKGVAVNSEFNTEAFHKEMQRLRNGGKDVTLKSFLSDTFGADMTPEEFYKNLGIDMTGMTVEKMLNTGELNKWLFPELFRDAIRRGLEYTPFYGTLVAGEEVIPGTGLTMPAMDFSSVDPNELRLRDTNEGATITEGQIIAWSEKQVTIKKKARGLKQTYESIMFTPIDLAAIYFEELGTQLGSDLDAELVNIALNGDQADGSAAAPVIGVTTPGTLVYADLARAWIRFRKIGRNSTVMLMSEDEALTIIALPEYQRTQVPGAQVPAQAGFQPPTLNLRNPLPTSQDILIHDSMPDGKIVLIDVARAFIQLTAMPLLIESDKIVSRQIQGEYVSIITGFANIFADGRLVLDVDSSLVANPGPAVPRRG